MLEHTTIYEEIWGAKGANYGGMVAMFTHFLAYVDWI